jgi:hypothetical protein
MILEPFGKITFFQPDPLVLFLLLRWRCCHPQAGVIAPLAMVSSSSLMHRHPCRHHNGVVALVAMAFLSLMCRHLCHHCNGDCRPHQDGVSAIVKLAYSLSWHCCPCNNGVVAIINAQASLLSSSWHSHPCCNGVALINAQASLQSRHLYHSCNNLVPLVAMALLLLSSWCLCPCHDGVIVIVYAQVSLPLSRWRHRTCCAGAITNIARVLLPLLRQHCRHYLTNPFALM